MGAERGDRSPAASLGLLDATMVGIGAMIGAGIFVLTGLAADIAGPAALLVFALNGGVTTFTALSYAELASAIPKNGGGYAYIRETFSAPIAFVMGWTRWFTYMAAGALYAIGFASNFVEFVHLYWAGLPAGPVWEAGYALLAVASFIALNALSTEASGGAETIVTLVKIAILGVFILFGISAVSSATFFGIDLGTAPNVSDFFSNGVAEVLPAMGLTFIAFQGYDLIATVTEEVKNPEKNIPRAIFISLGVTVVIYLLVVGVAIGTLGAPRLGEAGEKAVVEAAISFMPDIGLFGASIGAALMGFGAVFSTISALNAVVIGSSRVAFAMGREGQLLGRFGNIHHEYGTPFSALMVSAAIMLVATVVAPISLVGNLASLFSLLGFVVVNLAVIKLRRDQPSLNRPFEIPFYPAPPLLGCALNLILAAFIPPLTWVVAVGWLLFGSVVYATLNREQVREFVSDRMSDASDTGSPEESNVGEPIDED
jgi:amino acid transporter